MIQEIHTNDAPGAVGPFSQAIKVDDLLFVSGQLPIDPATGEFNSDDAIAQAEQQSAFAQSAAEPGLVIWN